MTRALPLSTAYRCAGATRLGVFLTLIVSASTASAQAPVVDRGLTPRQVLIQLTSAAGEGGGVSNVGEVIADLVGLEVSTAPIGSSAGGFTFTFDPVTRSFSRAAPSFGPMFGDRAITAGPGRAGFGINYIRSTYDRLDGIALDDGSLQTIVLRTGSTPVVSGTTELHISTNTLVMFGNVALNDWFDASVAVPLITLRVEGIHRIADQLASGAATASGLGDVALRGKVRLHETGQGGVALGVDLRLPTGDPAAMLGAGVTRTLVSGIWSSSVGPVAPHASAGFEYWSDPFRVFDPLQQAAVEAGRHAFTFNGGVEWPATDRLTVNGELTGRTLRNGGRLEYRELPMRGNPFDITNATVASVSPRGGSRISLAGGIKWNLAGTALLTATVVVPLNDTGLTDRFTPVLGLDWGF
jgi:hypothetical protein